MLQVRLNLLFMFLVSCFILNEMKIKMNDQSIGPSRHPSLVLS